MHRDSLSNDWSVWSRLSVFSLKMLYKVIIYVVWNAVDLYI